MSAIEGRIVHLEQRAWKRPAPPPGDASAFVSARLTAREQDEIDRLLALVAPLPGDPAGLGALTDGQLERLHDLTRKGGGLPPEPAYRYMRHRDPGIGPCLCPRCLAAAAGGAPA